MADFLYIHIPFCVKKCAYCDFFSLPYNESSAKAYVDALCKELLLKRELGGSLKSVYIGGGTPSLLPEECFTKLFGCLRDNFDLSPSVEITVEANPGTLNESKVTTILSLGANRLSIGVQSFDDCALKILGRIHTAEDAIRSIDFAKAVGFKNLSLDFMYGIPGQSGRSWHKSLSRAVGILPAHISAYELTPEENTPLFASIQCGETVMPDEESILEQYDDAVDFLTSNGYEHYEISNFALPGFRCLHNLNYWDRGEYIGVGAGAHSFVCDTRSQNTKDIDTYTTRLNEGVIPEVESVKLTRTMALREFIFLGLRKTDGISIDKAERLGLNILTACKEMIDSDHLQIRDDTLSLTRKGIAISNTIIAGILEKTGL